MKRHVELNLVARHGAVAARGLVRLGMNAVGLDGVECAEPMGNQTGREGKVAGCRGIAAVKCHIGRRIDPRRHFRGLEDWRPARWRVSELEFLGKTR